MHNVAFSPVQEGAAQRRFITDPASAWVGLCRSNDGIYLGRTLAFLNGDLGTHLDGSGLAGIADDASSGQEDLKFLYAAFNESLLVLGSLIFGIFDQFAALHGFMQALGDLGTLGAT